MKGRPPFEPTDEMRRTVERLAACGVPQDDIGRVLVPGGIVKHTLIKYFREELDTGAIRANALIAGSLFNKAKSGDTASMIFWLKTRARWREVSTTELTGANGAPLVIAVNTGVFGL